jgi:AcrR family transcriptional regulator
MIPGVSSVQAARSRATARRERGREIVAATRALFDERGMQDAPIEDIAAAAGINKALIYRHFDSKEDLFVATMVSYLLELAERLDGVERDKGPAEQLTDGWERFVDYCLEHPAFVDCSLSLLRRPMTELEQGVSEAVLFRLAQAMADCLGRLSRILARGAAAGDFAIEDPDFTANHLYTQTLGAMHLVRIGIGVRRSEAGIPEVFAIDPRDVATACVQATLAAVEPRG